MVDLCKGEPLKPDGSSKQKQIRKEDEMDKSTNREQSYQAKAQVVRLMNQGIFWQEAVAVAGLSMSRASAYRLQRRVNQEGETALSDGRHGHIYKLREPIRHWLKTSCHQAPQTPSHLLQSRLREQFQVEVSVGYLNQVRAQLGVSYQRPKQEKKVHRQALGRDREDCRGRLSVVACSRS
jgi:transposase